MKISGDPPITYGIKIETSLIFLTLLYRRQKYEYTTRALDQPGKINEEEQEEARKETDSNQGKESHTPTDKQKFAYEVAMKQLRIHAPLIWRRNAFFPVANTAIIVNNEKFE